MATLKRVFTQPNLEVAKLGMSAFNMDFFLFTAAFSSVKFLTFSIVLFYFTLVGPLNFDNAVYCVLIDWKYTQQMFQQ